MPHSIYSDGLRLEPWWWEAAPPEASADASLPGKCDVAIVGAGFTGLSAALTLARAGRDVLVLEAERPGQGASSRNGGMVGSGHRRSFAALAESYGKRQAAAIIREGLDSLAFTTGLIEREQIACHFERFGRFRAAWRPEHYEALGREADLMAREFGQEMQMVPRGEQARETASGHYFGGAIHPDHGGLHPGLFLAGLLDRCRAAGATVMGRSPVTGISRAGRGFTLAVGGQARITAGEVIVATNGYSGPAMPDLQRRLLPACSYIIATEPQDPALMARLLPGRRMMVETRNRHCYYRLSPDGRRMIYGGRAALQAIDPRKAVHVLRGLMVELYPELAGAKISHSWRGNVAFTRPQLPHLGVQDGLHLALGYCGSGVAMAPYLGHKIALKVLGDPAGDSPFETTPFPPIPFYRGGAWFLTALHLYHRLKDRLEGPGR